MDHFFALASWLAVRDDRPGFVFFNIAAHEIETAILPHDPWSRKAVVEFMQSRFKKIGFGEELARSHTAHSAKRVMPTPIRV